MSWSCWGTSDRLRRAAAAGAGFEMMSKVGLYVTRAAGAPKGLTLLLVLLHCTCGRAQTPNEAITPRVDILDADAFFRLPDNATETTLAYAQKTFRPSWIERTELRTETRDFDFGQQRYTLRVLPNTPGKARAQAALAQWQGARPDFDAEEAVCDRLRNRYEDWLELYATDTELRLTRRLDTILADRATVLDRLSASLDFEWSELIALNRSRTDLALRLLALNERRNAVLREYNLTATELDFTGFPDPEQLDLANDSIAALREDPEMLYDLEMATRELELERAERRQYLRFVQAEYSGPHEDPFRERFAIGAGFQLPSDGNSKLKIRELELEQQQLIRDQERKQEETKRQLTSRRTTLLAELSVYRQVRDLLAAEDDELNRIAQRITRRAGFDPLALLSIEERKLKNNLRLLDARKDLLERYLELKEGDLCAMQNGELWGGMN